MTVRRGPPPVEHFDRLTALFDRARTGVPGDPAALADALDEAALALDAFREPASASSAGSDRAVIAAAARRARESHELMTDTIGRERERLGRELATLAAGADATAGYGVARPAPVAPLLSRVG